MPLPAEAAYPQLLYRYQHHLFAINPNDYPSWRTTKEVWSYNGEPMAAVQALRVDGDELPQLPPGVTRSLAYTWNEAAIANTLYERIAKQLNRPRGEVAITQSGGAIVFDGVGFLGKEVQMERLVQLTITALDNGVTDIHVPVQERQPIIHVLDPDLQDQGIKEVVAIGESNYAYSPGPRRHNISVGLSKFNGHVIPQGSVFSFNETLGPVNGRTGYLKELVILGDKTLPDYGGGLCQVSTTAFRGIWEYGFPIEERKNHSYSVSYYSPQGTDATIYPPAVDMKFRNDSPGSLLIQTHEEADRAYFIYYGTRDEREAEIVGPYTWDHRSPPPDKVEYTTDLQPGERRQVGKAVPGLKAAWFRVLADDNRDEYVQGFYSHYEARPNFTQVGQVSVPTLEEIEANAARREERLQLSQ